MQRLLTGGSVLSVLLAMGLGMAQAAVAEPDLCGSGPMTTEMAQCLIGSATEQDQQAAVWAYKHGDQVCDIFQTNGVNIDALTQAKVYLRDTIGFSPAKAADVVNSSVLWNCADYLSAVSSIN